MKIFVSAVALSFVGLVACSSSDEAGSSADRQAAVNAVCDHLNTCLPAAIKIAFGDVATCKTQTLASANDPANKPPGEVDPTKAQLDGCVAALSSASCEDELLPDACDFRGTLADGAACSRDSQCAGGYCSQPNEGCGTCATLGAEGGVCSDTKPCGNKLTCVSGTCKAHLSSGADCSTTTADCAAGLRCIGGKCAAALAEGADCSTDGQACAFNLYCDGTCKKLPEPQYATAGGACGPGISCSVSRCDPTTMKCVAFAKLGEACTKDGNECGNGLECDPTTSKCVNFLTCN